MEKMKSPAISQAMDILKMLRQISEAEVDISEKLEKIIVMIVRQMKADAGACYIQIDENYLELFASCGYSPEADHNITIRIGEGLVGEVAKSKKSLVVSNVWKHPQFSYQPSMAEDKYKSFLGVPLIRWGRVIGIITLQHKKTHEYSNSEVEIAETVAMILSDLVASDEMSEFKNELFRSRGQSGKEKYKGISLSNGYGMGTAIVHRRRQAVSKIFADDKDAERQKLDVAYAKMNQDLDDKFTSTQLGIGEHVNILEAYRMFAKDKGWYNKITNNINSGLTAEAAVERAYEDMWNRLSGTQDTYMRERLHDLRDVADRLLGYLCGDENSSDSKDLQDIIVVAKTMGPADLMDYDYHKIRGLIIEDGTPTMHVSIVAKALGIPVISKIRGICKEIKNGQLIAIDGTDGYVYIEPTEQVKKKFISKQAEKQKAAQRLSELKKLPSKTKDGTRINLYLNVGLSFDLDYIETTNCDGIGLYRTEIPFMASDTMPDVEKQTSYYQELMDRVGRKKVIFRSLDVGSDKLLPYWSYGGEDNPAIGWRSIRITLDRRAILRKQMRAFLRAAAGKELNVMFPMISNLAEFQDAKETLMIELEKEKRKGQNVPKQVNVGLMIEVPSIVFQLDAVLQEADFISIGTNDLAQFIFACDRGNPKLSNRYDVLSAPFLKMMHDIVQKANQAGVPCSVCGEMAANPIEALALIGIGYRNLSMSGASIGRVKSMVRSVKLEDIEDYMKTLLKSNRRTLRPQLISYANDHGIEIC
ncbi:MAG: phosphoenolpyruvate--protein phosphotransferase [Alphaproteobacteria bacterium]|nr:phosphoenolpyruvate--protein phosphotransferase [Alphaproteobacteria bacterium]